MTVSIFDLPKDEADVLPAGKWVCALADRISDSFGVMTFAEGVTTEPIDGRALIKACTFFVVEGAKRVEGEPCELGDMSRLTAFGAKPIAQPAAAPVVSKVASIAAPPAPIPTSSPIPTPKEPAAPKTMRELEALDEDALRKLGAKHGLTDKRWSTQKLVRELGEELNLAD